MTDRGWEGGRSGPVAMLALDLDGTVCGADLAIDPALLDVLSRLDQERGIRPVVATARPPRSARRITAGVAFDPVQICYGGAAIIDTGEGRYLANRHIEPLSALLAYDLVKEVLPASNLTLESDDAWYIERYTDEIAEHVRVRGLVEPRPERLDRGLLAALPVSKLFFHSRDEEACRGLQQDLGARLGSGARTRLENGFFEITPNIDKLDGLAFVARLYEIPLERVMAVGDGVGDYRMLAGVGFGVKVGRADGGIPFSLESSQALAPFLARWFGIAGPLGSVGKAGSDRWEE